MPFFSFTGEGKRGETFTHKSLFHRFLPSYGEEVKQITKNAGRARNARALGAEVRTERAEVGGGGIHDREGRPNSSERGLSVVAASLQMSGESFFCRFEVYWTAII